MRESAFRLPLADHSALLKLEQCFCFRDYIIANPRDPHRFKADIARQCPARGLRRSEIVETELMGRGQPSSHREIEEFKSLVRADIEAKRKRMLEDEPEED